MIQLPDNWQQTARVNVLSTMQKGVLFLHFKNDANQYFTFMQVLDPAFSLEDTLNDIATKSFWADHKAYVLGSDLTTMDVEPLDQNWVPAPTPGPDMISLAQYKALKAMPNAA